MLDNKNIKKHYQKLYQQHGLHPNALQWRDQETQIKRFEILSEVNSDLGSVLDIGSGFGDLLTFLQEGKGFFGHYGGVEFVDEFVKESEKLHKNTPQAKFYCLDIENDPFPKGFDTLFLSGVFNNQRKNQEEFICHTINKMFQACNKQIAFNCLSTYVDYFDEGLYYTDPLKLFDFCKKAITQKVTLRHDYLLKKGAPPFEFTMYLYR